MMQFQAGDVVRLRSGGPAMTVFAGNVDPDGEIPLATTHPSQMVEVEWFVGGVVSRDRFLACELIKAAYPDFVAFPMKLDAET